MNCYKHHDVPSVATCAQGCGRGLCPECTEKHEPPTCDNCAAKINEAVSHDINRSRIDMIKRIIINALFFIPYVIVLSTEDPPGWLMVPMIIWGFIGFRWLMDGFLHLTGLVIFDSVQGMGLKYFIGSVFCSVLGVFVIPIQIVIQLIQLNRIPKSA